MSKVYEGTSSRSLEKADCVKSVGNENPNTWYAREAAAITLRKHDSIVQTSKSIPQATKKQARGVKDLTMFVTVFVEFC